MTKERTLIRKRLENASLILGEYNKGVRDNRLVTYAHAWVDHYVRDINFLLKSIDDADKRVDEANNDFCEIVADRDKLRAVIASAEAAVEENIASIEKAEDIAATLELIGAIVTRLNRQLDVSDEYAKKEKTSKYTGVWEIQNDHLRDLVEELQTVISEVGDNE